MPRLSSSPSRPGLVSTQTIRSPAARPQGDRGEHADRSGAEHDRRIVGTEPGDLDRVDPDRERLGERRIAVVELLGQDEGAARRDDHRLGEGARPVFATEPRFQAIRAELGEVAPARIAFPARLDRIDDDVLAERRRVHRRSLLDHDAGKLVPHHRSHRAQVGHLEVVQVRAADPAEGDREAHVVVAQRSRLHLHRLHATILGDGNCSHFCPFRPTAKRGRYAGPRPGVPREASAPCRGGSRSPDRGRGGRRRRRRCPAHGRRRPRGRSSGRLVVRTAT